MIVKNEDALCYARPIRGKGALALGPFELARSFHIHTGRGQEVVERVERKHRLFKESVSRHYFVPLHLVANMELWRKCPKTLVDGS